MDETIASVCGEQAAQHVNYLRETLIPDLRQSGYEQTAEDFVTLLETCRDLATAVQSLTTFIKQNSKS